MYPRATDVLRPLISYILKSLITSTKRRLSLCHITVERRASDRIQHFYSTRKHIYNTFSVVRRVSDHENTILTFPTSLPFNSY